jgi:hypothetical protein
MNVRLLVAVCRSALLGGTKSYVNQGGETELRSDLASALKVSSTTAHTGNPRMRSLASSTLLRVSSTQILTHWRGLKWEGFGSSGVY